MKPIAILLSAFALCLFAPTIGCDGVQSGTFDSSGVAIHYQFAGSGQPVIFIHGHFNCIFKDQFQQELKHWLDENASRFPAEVE